MDWGLGSIFVPDEHSVQGNRLVDMNEVLLPSIRTKHGLMKNFVRAKDKDGAAFQHLRTLFSALSSDKLKQGIFDKSQIHEVLMDNDFEELLILED